MDNLYFIKTNNLKPKIMSYLINQPVHESRGSEKVIEILHEGDFSHEVEDLIESGSLLGCYYSDDVIVFEDIWGNLLEA